jgi:hypothetical protein
MLQILSKPTSSLLPLLSTTIFFITVLSKLANEEQVLGVYEAQDRSVHKVRDNLSTGMTTQLPSVVEFRKNSIFN